MTPEPRRIGGPERASTHRGRRRLYRARVHGLIGALAVLAIASCQQRQADDAAGVAPDAARTTEAVPAPMPTPETASAMDATPPDSISGAAREADAERAETAEAGSAAPAETPSATPESSAQGRSGSTESPAAEKPRAEAMAERTSEPATPTSPAPNAAEASRVTEPGPAEAPAAGQAAEAPAAGQAADAQPISTPEVARSDTPPAEGGQTSLVASEEAYQGWKYFSANCERCHGQDAVGSSFAPSLVRSVRESSIAGGGPVTKGTFIGVVTAGRPAKGMPPWKDLLSPEQIEQIWAYVSARASGKLAAGRPQRAAS